MSPALQSCHLWFVPLRLSTQYYSSIDSYRSVDMDQACRVGGNWVHWSRPGHRHGQTQSEGKPFYWVNMSTCQHVNMSTWPHCQAAHEAQVSKGNVILDDFQPGSNSVRDERDKPFDPFGVTKEQEGQIPTIAPTVSQLHLPLTRDKGNGDWVRDTRYLHSFFFCSFYH